MASAAEALHQSERANYPVLTDRDEILEALTEFESESGISIGGARIEPAASDGWGYMALLTAFALGMCAAILAMLGWAALAVII